MIFVTVGTQLPFDRLIRAMDQWTALHSDVQVVAQIGKGSYTPTNLTVFDQLGSQQFRSFCENASVIVSHAGVGTILLALELQKPVVLLPRRAEFKEHRNDHQLATVKQFENRPGIKVVYSEADIGNALCEVVDNQNVAVFNPWASEELLDAIGHFIDNVRV